MVAVTLAVVRALAADPRSLAVTYTARFDLPPDADQVCPMTAICDCKLTWSGTGTLREGSGDRLTFEGTWAVTEGSCNDAFVLWTPSDGTAYHTIRLSADRTTVTEWIAHDKLGDSTRFQSDIKARGQVWLTGMTAVVDGTTGTAVHFERETGDVGPFKLTTEHSLSVTLGP